MDDEKMTRLISLVLTSALLLSACTTGNTVGDVQRNTDEVLAAVGKLENAALVLYSTGADPDPYSEDCNAPKFRLPAVLSALDGQTIAGHRVAVVKYCYASKRAFYDPDTDQGMTRTEVRNRELAALLADLEDAGLPRERIILAGHSEGGWNSLIYLAKNPGGAAGVIAFSPAQHGQAFLRTLYQRARWNLELNQIRGASTLPALVYWVEGDPYMESTSQLDFLRRVPGSEYRVLQSATRVGGVRCTLRDPHLTVFESCFTETQAEHIADFIRVQLEEAPTR